MMTDYILCKVCGKRLKEINDSHLRSHNMTRDEYVMKFGELDMICDTSRVNKGDGRRGKPDTKHSERMTGENNPMWGVKRSQDEKNYMSFKRKGKGVGVAGKYIRTPEMRSKISLGVINFLKNNPSFAYENSKFMAGKYYSSKMGEYIVYRSSWELYVMFFLDEHPHITSWTYEPFPISYKDDFGTTRNYLPDFLITWDFGIKEIWEVKPTFKLKDKSIILKIDALNDFLKTNDLGICNGFILDDNWFNNIKTYDFSPNKDMI